MFYTLTHLPRNYDVINCLSAELIICLTSMPGGRLLATSTVKGLMERGRHMLKKKKDLSRLGLQGWPLQ